MGSFRESSYYAQSVAWPQGESVDIASRPPRPKASRQTGAGPSSTYRCDRDAEPSGSASQTTMYTLIFDRLWTMMYF